MARLAILAVVVIGCHHAEPRTSESSPCPGPYPITPGTCTTAAPTDCHGVCGVVVRAQGCSPPAHAEVVILSAKLAVPTDAAGHFDIGPLPAGHYHVEVRAEQDTGTFELDATGSPQVLPAPLELRLWERSCQCGGACPT
jgi:hypothetical protein